MKNIEQNILKEITLFTELGAHPLRRGGVILIPCPEIRNLLNRLLDENVRILGLDGFKLYPDNKIQPFMEFSTDYSNTLPSMEVLDEFLCEASEAVTHFEVVIEE